jgi:hypothetical protein
MYIVKVFFGHGIVLVIIVIEGLGKVWIVFISYSSSLASSWAYPFVGVEFGWQLVWNNAWNLVTQSKITSIGH